MILPSDKGMDNMSCFSFQAARRIRGCCPRTCAGSTCLPPPDPAGASAQQGFDWAVLCPQQYNLAQEKCGTNLEHLTGVTPLILAKKAFPETKVFQCSHRPQLETDLRGYVPTVLLSLSSLLSSPRKAPELLHLVALPGNILLM